MIGTKKPNLICTDGHRFWAPHPEQWVGKDCKRAEETDGRGSRCLQPLREIRGQN